MLFYAPAYTILEKKKNSLPVPKVFFGIFNQKWLERIADFVTHI